MLRSRLALLSAALLFSTGGAAIKSCSLSSWQVAGFRSGIAMLAVLLLLPSARRRWNPATFLTGLAYAATMLLFVSANKLTSAASTIFLQSTAPLYLILLGPRLLGEPVRRRDLGFVLLFAIGTVLLFDAGRPTHTATDPGLGNRLAALSGLSWALTVGGLRWIEKRPNGPSGSPAALVVGNGMAFLLCFPMALPLGSVPPADWMLLGYLGVFQVALAYLLLAYGVRRVSALEASLLLLLEPVLNPVWAWLVHGEMLGPGSGLGGFIVLAASVLKIALETRPQVPVGLSARRGR